MEHLKKPFTVIPKIQSMFFIWVLYILFFGNLGSIVSFFLSGQNIKVISKLAQNGTYFLFSITLLAASLSAFFIDFLKENEVTFKKLKITAFAVSVVTIVSLSLVFSSQINANMGNQNYTYWKSQLFLTAFSVILAVYIFCINHLHLYPDEYQNLEGKKIRDMEERSKKTDKDEYGTKL